MIPKIRHIVLYKLINVSLYTRILISVTTHMNRYISCCVGCRQEKKIVHYCLVCLVCKKLPFFSLHSAQKMLNWSVCLQVSTLLANLQTQVNSWLCRHPLPIRVCRYFYLLLYLIVYIDFVWSLGKIAVDDGTKFLSLDVYIYDHQSCSIGIFVYIYQRLSLLLTPQNNNY